MPYATRRAYAGAAATCTLAATIASDASTASLTGTVSNWPDTANGPFYMVLDPGLATEEKVLVGSRSGTSLSSLTRGVDGTQAAQHSTSAICYPVFTAVDADQANKVVSTLTTKGDLLVTDGTVLNRLAVGTAKHVLVATTGATNGVSWAQIDADGIATSAVTSDKILAGAVTPGKLSSYPKLIIPHTFAVGGPVNVQSGQVDYILPFFVRVPATQTVKLISARHRINSGTSATAKVQVNGSDATGFTGMAITTASTDTDPADITLSNNDLVSLVVTAVSGAPQNMSVTVFFEYTWTG